MNVTGGDAKGQQFPPIIDDKMQFEAIKPAGGGFPPAGDLLEDFVAVDATVVADH